jgi:hypothetical protein
MCQRRLTSCQLINVQPNDNESIYRAMIALGNVICAARQSSRPLSEEEIVKVRATVESVEKSSYAKQGQSAADAAVDKARTTSVGKEILSIL